MEVNFSNGNLIHDFEEKVYKNPPLDLTPENIAEQARIMLKKHPERIGANLMLQTLAHLVEFQRRFSVQPEGEVFVSEIKKQVNEWAAKTYYGRSLSDWEKFILSDYIWLSFIDLDKTQNNIDKMENLIFKHL